MERPRERVGSLPRRRPAPAPGTCDGGPQRAPGADRRSGVRVRDDGPAGRRSSSRHINIGPCRADNPDMPSARGFLPLAFSALALGVIAGCSGGVLPIAESLQAPETFRWNVQPITFRPPPTGWRREGENGSGRLGIEFIKTGSVGEAISIGECYWISERDRRAELHQLVQRVLALDEYDLRRALSLARWRTDDTYSANEAATADEVNEHISHA